MGISGALVELNADFNILLMCASGASNKSIGKFLDLDESDVTNILEKNFGFPGWFSDLSMNPYKIYTSTQGNQDRFYESLPTPNMNKFLFGICEMMNSIEDRLKNEWV